MKMNWWGIVFLLLMTLLCSDVVDGQQYDTVNIKHISLDSFVVKRGFSMNAFIKRVQNDTSFYKAFRSLHLVPFTAVNDFKVYDKHGKVVASMHANAVQKITAKKCRVSSFADKIVTGDFYDRHNNFNYYTAALFYDLFYSDVPVCNQNDIVAGALNVKGKGRMEQNKYELKQLIFNPGSKVQGIPFMGDKASVFDADEVDKYIFKVTTEQYEGEDVYVFSIVPKPEYMHKVVYNELKTWFRQRDYSIMARDYSLSYNTLFYDFDLHMKVRMALINNKLYPTHIDYKGNWHIATKNREQMSVVMDIQY